RFCSILTDYSINIPERQAKLLTFFCALPCIFHKDFCRRRVSAV
ncbi:hypothetical protein DESPIG_00531, partial [Desulfovibrio piger ATCC 29098]